MSQFNPSEDRCSWMEALYDLGEDMEKIEKACDLLFEKIDDQILEDAFAQCNEDIQKIDLERLNTCLMVSLLSITLWRKEELPARAGIVQQIDAILDRIAPERKEGLLEGLR